MTSILPLAGLIAWSAFLVWDMWRSITKETPVALIALIFTWSGISAAMLCWGWSTAFILLNVLTAAGMLFNTAAYMLISVPADPKAVSGILLRIGIRITIAATVWSIA
jgi:hypothetical protein